MTDQNQQAFCFHCQAELTELLSLGSISRQESCPQCSRDVRVCKNCRFFDARAYNECSESQADRVVEKEKANFCDYFELRITQGSGDAQSSERENQLAAAEALFKKN